MGSSSSTPQRRWERLQGLAGRQAGPTAPAVRQGALHVASMACRPACLHAGPCGHAYRTHSNTPATHRLPRLCLSRAADWMSGGRCRHAGAGGQAATQPSTDNPPKRAHLLELCLGRAAVEHAEGVAGLEVHRHRAVLELVQVHLRGRGGGRGGALVWEHVGMVRSARWVVVVQALLRPTAPTAPHLACARCQA